MSAKMCVLEERICTRCGECDFCDLDPVKICNNCQECLGTEAEYRAIAIDAIIIEPEERQDRNTAGKNKKENDKQ